MTFGEYRKKEKEKQASVKTEKKENLNDNSYGAYRKRQEINRAGEQITELYNSLAREAQALSKDVNTRYYDAQGNYIEQYRPDYAEWKTNVVGRSSTLQNQSKIIKVLLDKYGEYYDEDFVSKLSTSIAENDAYFKKVADVATSDYDLFSQGEDKYFAYKMGKDYEDYSYNDLQKEIAELEKSNTTNDEALKNKVDFLRTYAREKDYETSSDYESAISDIGKQISEKYSEWSKVSMIMSSFEEAHREYDDRYKQLEVQEKELSNELDKLRTDKSSLEANMKEKKKEEEINAYTNSVKSKSDFEEKSKYTPGKLKTVEELKAEGYVLRPGGGGDPNNPLDYHIVDIAGSHPYTGGDSDLYTYINNLDNDEIKRAIESSNTTATPSHNPDKQSTYIYNDYIESGYHLMEEDEIGVYNALYLEDRDKAWEYIQMLKPILQKRAMAEEAERLSNSIDGDAGAAIFMSAASFVPKIQDSYMFLPKVTATAMGVYDEMPWLNTYGNRTDAIRGTVSQNLDENAGHIFAMGYSGLMSMGDMALAMGASGGFNAVTEAEKKAASKLTQAIMSSSAGSSTISNAKVNGKSDGEALVLGLGSAAIEWATEKYSVEALLSDPTSIKGYLWQNYYTEALEEGASNVSNIALDELVSYISGNKSEIQSNIDYLVLNEGLTREEAGKRVLLQKTNELFEDMVVGGFTGFGMSSAAVGTGFVSTKADETKLIKQAGIDITDNKRVGELVDIANATGNEKLMKLAEQVAGVEYESLSESKKNTYAKKIGKLYSKSLNTQGKAVSSISRDTVKNIVTEKLKNNGIENSKIDKAANTILKVIYDRSKRLSVAEDKLIKEVGGLDIINEVINSKDVGIEVGKAQKDALGKYIETASLTENKSDETVETDFDISDDGKTYIKDTDEAVAITGISSINKGKMMVNLSNGKTENIENLELNTDEAIIYQGILDMGVDASIGQFVAKTFEGSGVDANTYILGVKDAIRYGKIGGKAFLNEGTFTSELTEKMREDFYNIGEKYTRDAIAKEESTIARSIASNKGKKSVTGKVSFRGVDRSKLNARQKASVNAIEVAFGTMGINVVFFESPVNAEGKHIGKNGSYNAKTNTIELDISAGINAQDTILFTASHELTHFIKEWSPEKFKEFADFLVKQYHAHGVDVDALVKAKMEKFNLDYDTAFEEVVADSCESFLRDSNLVKILTDLAKYDMTLFERVKMYLDTLLENLNKAYEGLTPDSRESREVLKMKDCIKELHDMWDEAALVARENFQNAGGNKEVDENGAKYSWRNDKDGNKYWQIDTNKDIFKGLTTTQEYENAAFKYILGLRDGNVVVDAIDGKKMSFIRISASEFTGSDESQSLKENDAVMFAQKMRLIPSLEDLASNASVNWWSPDFKNHKLFKERGFENFRGRVGIDNVIFNFVIRAGKAKFGDIFYDINLEVDTTLPHTDGASGIQKSTSKNRISQKSNPVNTNSMQESDKNTEKKSERNYSYKELGYDALYTDSEVYSYDFLIHQKNIKVVELPKIDELKHKKNKIDKGKVVSLGLLNAETVGKKVEDKIYVKNRYTERDLLITSSAIRHGLNGDINRLFTNSRLGAVIGNIVKNAIPINALKTNEQNVNGTYAMAAYVKGAEGREIVAIVTVENRKGNVLGIETYDVIHSLSGRIKKVSNNPVGTKPQGFNPSTKVTDNISIADFLEIVNGVYRSILSKDVLKALGEENKESGYYTNRVLFSERDPDAIAAYEKVVATLESENAKLTEDVERLKELVKLQRTETHNKVLSKSSLDAAARVLMKYANAKGNRAELVKHLEDVYSYILQGEDVSWEGVMEKAENAVDWLIKNKHIKTERDEYANAILKDLRTSRFYLDEGQKKEVAYKYGNYNEFRKKTMGRFILTDNANMSLDSFWAVLAENYPGTFDASISSGDQPLALMDIIDGLQEGISIDHYGSAEMNRQDLLMSVYESYWDVSTLTTFADKKQKEINNLKYKHKEQMSKLRETHKDKTLQLKKEYNEKLAKVREKSYEKQQAIAKHYQEARKKNVEGRQKTVMRKKIKGVIGDLDKMLKAGRKKANVKVGMRDAVEQALATAELLFTNNITNEDIVRNGVSATTSAESTKLNRYMDLLAKREHYVDKIEAMLKVSTKANTDGYYKMIDTIDKEIGTLNKELSDVFERERNRLNEEVISSAIQDLADAYKAIENSEYSYISVAYNEFVYKRLLALKEGIGGTTIRDMSLYQLQEVYDAYKMVLHVVRTANTLFKEGKSVDAIAGAVIDEIKAISKYRNRYVVTETLNSAVWAEMKPRTAFEKIGSDTLLWLYDNLRKGEDSFAMDVYEAFNFAENARRRHNYKKWDMKSRIDFKLDSGKTFSINLQQLMSIYAYSKREQALKHMTDGGFVFDSKETFKKKKNSIFEMLPSAEVYRLSANDLSKIINTLSEKYSDAKAYVDEMQKYLTDMGEKGNEVSRIVFGIDLFKEKVYFPLQSSADYLRSKNDALDKNNINPSLINSGMTKEIIPNARNPIVLSSFDNVWASHTNKMSLYHSFVPALEDFRKVYQYSSNADGVDDTSVRAEIRKMFGDNAVDYISKLLDDINGGMPNNEVNNPMMSLFSTFKKTAVGMSLSTVIQQPTAIIRAWAMINPKYFVNMPYNVFSHKQWEEIKKYAPVAILKEIGGFDAGSGRGMVDYLAGDANKNWLKKTSATIDDVSMWLAGEGDVLGWGIIWNAVKKEVRETTNLAEGSEEFFTKCGERFTELITETQVYDSIFSRSGIMRSKNELNKFATSFMAEPTTAINMIYKAVLNAKRGKISKGKASAIIGSAVLSTFIASILVSLIYAARDDDEDESFGEKYAEALGGRIRDDINPLNMLPYLRNIQSIFDGWDVERPDMAIFVDIKKAYDGLQSKTKSPYMKWRNFISAMANAFGVPLGNAERDLRAMFYNVPKMIFDDETPTRDNVLEAFGDGFTGKENGSSEEYSKYGNFISAVETGKNIKIVINEYTDNGVDEKTLASQITKHFKPLYVEMSNYERANIKGYLLNAYALLGYDRKKKSKDIDKWLED